MPGWGEIARVEAEAMGAHQVYEFASVDRALTATEVEELRGVSSRAEITNRRFWNEYHWGDLRADARRLLARYFDVHVYRAEWGEVRVMVRLPADRVDVAALRGYVGSRHDELRKIGDCHVLTLTSGEAAEADGYEDEELDMDAMIAVRAGLLAGDMRAPYMAWLLAVQDGVVADGAREPPVPAGLATLSEPLVTLADMLMLDEDLLDAAAEAAKGTRTAAQLLARAAEIGAIAEQEAEREEVKRAEREAAARVRRLTALLRQAKRAWAKLEALIDVHRPTDEALELAVDLHHAYQRRGAEFHAQLDELRRRLGPRRRIFTRIEVELERRRKAEGVRRAG